MLWCYGQLQRLADQSLVTSPHCLKFQNLVREYVHSYLSVFMLSENMMGSIFRIAETAHHIPTSIYYVHVTVIFNYGSKALEGPRPPL